MASRHLLLWDGTCGFCARSAAWIERRDRQHLFDIVAYQEAPSPPMTSSLRAACTRSMHVIASDGRILRGGRACLFVLARLGHPLAARILSLPPLVWLVELGYRLVASNRRLFSRLFVGRDASGQPGPTCGK
jgi:predicted DCC family thiol-disulfide oxidoreductase YuxK